MRWHHTHTWAIGILTGIIISQKAILLILLGAGLCLLFLKMGALYRLVMTRLNRRWAIRP